MLILKFYKGILLL